MIYITGDTHADFSRFEENKFPIQSEMTKNDYIIICGDFGRTSIQTLLNPSYKKDILTDYLQKISEKCEFKKWYFGHYHDYGQVNSQFTLLYENIVPLEFNSIFE